MGWARWGEWSGASPWDVLGGGAEFCQWRCIRQSPILVALRRLLISQTWSDNIESNDPFETFGGEGPNPTDPWLAVQLSVVGWCAASPGQAVIWERHVTRACDWEH